MIDLIVRQLFISTIVMTVFCGLVSIFLKRFHVRSSGIVRFSWLLVLVSGILMFRIPVELPLLTPKVSPDVATATHDTAVFHDEFREFSFPAGNSLEPANPISLETVLPASAETTLPEPILQQAPEAGKSAFWRAKFPVSVLIFSIWGTGILFFLVRGLVDYLSILRRLQLAMPETLPLWDALQKRADIAPDTVPILFSDTIGPVLIRLPRKHVLVLPEESWGELTGEAQKGILRHELAHYLRRDVSKSFAVWIVSLVHWFNPCAWLARRNFDDAAEWACDVAAHGGTESGVAAYVKALILIHEKGVPACSSSRTVYGRAVRGKRFSERIERLIHYKTGEESMTRKIIVTSLLSVSLVLSLFHVTLVAHENRRPDNQDVPAHSETQAENVTFFLLDEDGNPLSDGKVEIQGTVFDVDEQGKVSVPYEKYFENFTQLYIEASAPKHALWVIALHRQDGTWDEVKPEYTFKLKRGRTIAGKIVNANNEPIEGATVDIGYNSLSRRGWGERAGIVKTDAEGKFSCDTIPGGIEYVSLDITHPEYRKIQGHAGMKGLPTFSEFLGGTALILLQQGPALTGQVTELASGEPVADAQIYVATVYVGKDWKITKTDADGRFEVPNWHSEETIVAAVAPGLAPQTRRVDFSKDTSTQEFQLKPGNTIRIRVVDPEGNPIPDVRVSPFRWGGDNGQMTGSWRIVPEKTDRNGYYHWDWAPEEVIEYTLMKNGFLAVRDLPMTPREEEYVVTMYPPLEISGNVVDAVTGEPMKSFMVVPGVLYESLDRINWNRDNASTWNDGTGHYRSAFQEPKTGYHLRFEAEGYLPVESHRFTSQDGAVTFDLEMQPQSMQQAMVKLPGGQPAANISVYMIDGTGSQLFLHDNKPNSQSDCKTLDTDSQGMLLLPNEGEPYLILAIHDKGAALVSSGQLAESPTIQLLAWARVEGKLLIPQQEDAKIVLKTQTNTHPAMESLISQLRTNDTSDNPLVQMEMNQMRYSFYMENQAVVQPDGSFVIEKVFPKCKAGIDYHKYMQTGLLLVSVTYKSTDIISEWGGLTTYVTLGGAGIPVTGKIRLPETLRDQVEFKYGKIKFRPHIDSSEYPQFPDMPEEIEKLRTDDNSHNREYVEARNQWMAQWYQTPEGKELKRKLDLLEQKQSEIRPHGGENTFADEEGTFRLEDIEPGLYTFSVEIMKSDRSNPSAGYRHVLHGKTPVTIPEKPDRNGMDLGLIELEK